MFGQIAVSALIVAVILLILWGLRGFLLMPLKKGKNTVLTMTLRVTGPEPRLEETLDGLLWLNENGTLPADIVIEDWGMDDETRAVADIASKSRERINFSLGQER